MLALTGGTLLFNMSVQVRQDGIFKQGFAKVLGL